ncbi:MAG: GIY-YIG nuclease family protein [Hymenobacteraceae bacterium]|nr:GIY-YIG nuclease family protein [Hymenobacteraceae bacterium]
MSVSPQYYVYILANTVHTVLYVGVTNDLWRRVEEHRAGKSAFTARYNVHKLVYFEGFLWIQEAIAREKQLKAGSRQKKLELIREFNPLWKDLAAGDGSATE